MHAPRIVCSVLRCDFAFMYPPLNGCPQRCHNEIGVCDRGILTRNIFLQSSHDNSNPERLETNKWDSYCLAEIWDYIFCIKYKIWIKNKGLKWRINDKRKLRIELMKYDKYRYRQRNVNRKMIFSEHPKPQGPNNSSMI